MATSCAPRHHCNTDVPGWFSGDHPNTAQGVVNMKEFSQWRGLLLLSTANLRQELWQFLRLPACETVLLFALLWYGIITLSTYTRTVTWRHKAHFCFEIFFA